LGALSDFEAVPGFGLKCHISNVDTVSTKTLVVDEDNVSKYVEGMLGQIPLFPSFVQLEK